RAAGITCRTDDACAALGDAGPTPPVPAVTRLSELGLEPFAESDDEYAQMVAFRLPPCDAEAVERRLFDEHRIDVVSQTWRGEPTLRVSFQGYNDESDLDALVDALRQLGV